MNNTTRRAVHLFDPLARHWFVVRHDPLRADWTADRSEATPLLPPRLARMRELFPVELMGCEEHRIGEPRLEQAGEMTDRPRRRTPRAPAVCW